MTVSPLKSRFDNLAEKFPKKEFDTLHETMTFSEYYDLVHKNPALARTSHQRIYDMILVKGTETIKRCNKTVTIYKFFNDSQFPIFGLENTLEELVRVFRSAAGFYGTEKRIILLHGPVGSSKSTICRLIKKELEASSKTDAGALYSFSWKDLPPDLESESCINCPMHEDPLNLIPKFMRADLEKELNEIHQEQYRARFPGETPYPIRIRGELDPQCRFFMEHLLKQEKGDLKAVLDKYIEVRRICFSEADRCGIGTFQPKDEKNQDSTELTGDINFRKLGELGKDSDPRAFSFDGEFNIANRGVIEFIEVLKLDKAFLYDLLGAAQEQQIKPKKFAQTSIDLAIIGHTNNPEFQKLQADRTMEAIKDRTIKIDVPYLLEVSKELMVLLQDYGNGKVPQHIAPHTLEVAALWAVCTRLKDPQDKSCSLIEKAKLYDGKILPGWTEDRVKELRLTGGEGIEKGMSVRYTQNKISNALVNNKQYINPFIVLNEIQNGLDKTPLIDDKKDLEYYLTCITHVRNELNNILKKEVQEAISLDGNQMERLCQKYMNNVVAHIEGTKITDPYTNEEQDPDEPLMRAIEEKIDIPEPLADDFRRSLAGFAGGLAMKDKKFEWDSNPKLKKGLEKYMFEISKDTINIAKLNNGGQVVGHDQQEKIDTIRGRLIERFGYNEQSATDVMNYVSQLFARGDIAEE
jgi:serine protein kinase